MVVPLVPDGTDKRRAGRMGNASGSLTSRLTRHVLCRPVNDLIRNSHISTFSAVRYFFDWRRRSEVEGVT